MTSTQARTAGRPSGVRVDGTLLKRYRERAGLSRDGLAELVAATARTLQRAENEGVIGMPLLKQACQVLRLPVALVLRQDAETVRATLRSFGFAPGLPPTLIGRDSELTALRAKLQRPHGRLVLVLDGPIGVGKTSLAQRLAEDLADHFDEGIVWVRGDFSDVRLVQLEIARALGFDSQLPALAGAPSGSDWRQAFASHFWTSHRLLVLDDITDERQVDPFLADSEHVTIVATTRFKHVAEEIASEAFTVTPLPDASVQELLSGGLDRAQLERDPSGLERLLALIGGMPGIAHVAHTALRRERLTTPTSFLARLGVGARAAPDDRLTEAVVAYYDSLRRQLSVTAWDLFAALGVFGSEPTPLSWAAATAAISPDVVEGAASELLDAQIVDLYQASDGLRSEPWLRLATHPATAARASLSARLDPARKRIARHLVATLAAARAHSALALVQYFRRHQSLIRDLWRGLAEGLGAAPDLAALTDPLTLEAPVIEAERADLLIDVAAMISPLFFDHTIADAAEWLGLALAATRSTSDASRRGRVYGFCGWWRVINVHFGAQPGYHEAARAAFREAGRSEACMCVHLTLTMIEVATADPEAAGERLAAIRGDIDWFLADSVRHAPILCSLARSTFMGSTAPEPARESAALCRQGWIEERAATRPDLQLVATLECNEQSFLRVTGDENRAALARAVEQLRAVQPEPWLKAALLAHAACLGAPLGRATVGEAMAEARRDLYDCTRECPAELAPRLLWFVATCGLYELTRRASAGRSPMIRGGLAGHGVPSSSGAPPTIELLGNDALIMLSTEATGALLDLEYIDLALELADHFTAGRLVSPALRGLRALLAAEAPVAAG